MSTQHLNEPCRQSSMCQVSLTSKHDFLYSVCKLNDKDASVIKHFSFDCYI